MSTKPICLNNEQEFTLNVFLESSLRLFNYMENQNPTCEK